MAISVMDLNDIHGVFSVIGVLSILYAVARLCMGSLSFINIYFTRTNLNFKKFGNWAVVTGSTDGIGKGIAFELAKRKMNILLVSRNAEKLEKVSNEIQEKFMVETKYVTIDLSAYDNDALSAYREIANVAKNLNIGVLVNNAGMGASGEFLNAFSKSENKDVAKGIPKLVYCNDLSMAMISAIILPVIERNGTGGLVVNISSLAASLTMPNHAVYSASKKFNDTFTRALHDEYKGTGVIFQSIQPGVVSTNMTSNKKVSFTVPSYEAFATDAVNTFGKNVVTAGHYQHGILRIFISLLPESLVARALMR